MDLFELLLLGLDEPAEFFIFLLFFVKLLFFLSKILQLGALLDDQPILLIFFVFQGSFLVRDYRIEVVPHVIQALELLPQRLHLALIVLSLPHLRLKLLLQLLLLSVIVLFE